MVAQGRQHRARTALVTAALVAGVAGVAMLDPARPVAAAAAGTVAAPGGSVAVVPARVYRPLPWQSTAMDAPSGPASLLVTGVGAFAGNDLFGAEDHALVVGRDGSYRLVPFNGGAPSEEAVLLSPDGRSVAGDTSMQAAPVEDLVTRFGTAVLDLVTGQVRAFDAGVPVAWAPDGRTLLTRSTEPDRLRTLDPTTGAVRELLTLPYRAPSASFAAFSLDGRQVALQLGQTVHIVDLSTGASRPLADIGPDRRLAGAGAWLPEGQLALWRMAGCAHDCDPTELNDRRLSITYVDSRVGVEVPGPHLDALTGLGARLLGWQVDGDAVVEVFAAGELVPQATIGRSWLSDDTDLAGQPPRVLALHPGGGQEVLLALPDDARQVQVAGELLREDRFGGPSPSLATRVADWLGPKRWTVSAVVLLVLAAVTQLIRRRRKAASQGRSPARTRSADAD